MYEYYPAQVIILGVCSHSTEWEERSSIKKPDNSQVLKLIYRGRFLGQTVTMSCELLLATNQSQLAVCSGFFAGFTMPSMICSRYKHIPYIHTHTHTHAHMHPRMQTPTPTPTHTHIHPPTTHTHTALSIPAGKTTVLHMVIRDTIPENPSTGQYLYSVV